MIASALQAAEPARVAPWQTFPWGTLLTLGTVLATLMLAALINHLRSTFQTRESANDMANALRKDHEALAEQVTKLEQSCEGANKAAEEAYRMAQLTDRALGEQWQRVSQEIIQPVREMSKEVKETREMLIEYMADQKNQGKAIERLERRLDSGKQGGV